MRTAGFTLVELSIVLVIIGLIVGGVLVGNDLIESSRRLSVIKDLQKYQSGIYAFKNKYGTLPGDLTCLEVAAYLAGAFCSNSSPKRDGSLSYGTEGFSTWQQLAMTGLIEGSYNGLGYNGAGLASAGTNPIVMGYDVPEAKLQGVGYQVDNVFGNLFNWPNGTVAIFIARPGSTGPYDVLNTAFLSPSQAEEIDVKTDDGQPYTGNFRSRIGSVAASACILGSGATATYNLAATTPNCYLGFVF